MKVKEKSGGFTLIELLVVMVISGVVMAAIYSTYISQQRAYDVTEAVSEVQQNIRAAMYFMERDIRMAGYDPSGSGNFGFVGKDEGSWTSSSISFTYDINENGTVDTNETITYTMSGNNIQRTGDGLTSQPIAENISGVSFQFLTNSGGSAYVASNVRSIDITLSGSKDVRGHTWQKDLNTRILCRNMGLGS